MTIAPNQLLSHKHIVSDTSTNNKNTLVITNDGWHMWFKPIRKNFGDALVNHRTIRNRSKIPNCIRALSFWNKSNVCRVKGKEHFIRMEEL